MKGYMRAFWADTQGQDMVEYALIAALVALGAVATLPTLGSTLNTVFSTISSRLSSALA